MMMRLCVATLMALLLMMSALAQGKLVSPEVYPIVGKIEDIAFEETIARLREASEALNAQMREQIEAIPDPVERQERSTVMRVQSDLRRVNTALVAYSIDNTVYPAHIAGADPHAVGFGNAALSTVSTFRAGMWDESMAYSLTTPVAYLTEHINDPFITESGGLPFAYWSDGDGWLLWSAGPDGDHDITLRGIEEEEIYASSVNQPSPVLIQFSYDCTNGLGSSGDIFRTSR